MSARYYITKAKAKRLSHETLSEFLNRYVVFMYLGFGCSYFEQTVHIVALVVVVAHVNGHGS